MGNLQAAREIWERHAGTLVPLIIAATAIPLVAAWVPPNRWYGFRTPLSMSSPEAWYASNRVLGMYMLGSQVIAVLSRSKIQAWLAARRPCDETAVGVTWACAMALLAVLASVAHVYSRA